MTRYENIKKEVLLQCSKFFPIKIRKGISNGMTLYGNIFYNRRSNGLCDEELLFSNLNLKNKTVLEAGAELGIYSLYFASQIYGGKLIVFEPNPLNFYFLRKNLSANSVRSAITVNRGLSNIPGKLHFVSKKYNTAKGTFKTDKHEILRQGQAPILEKDIEVITVDQAVVQYELDRVDFVKIDTEGFEPYIIEGMTATLQQFKPILYFEIHGLDKAQKQDDLNRIFNCLDHIGYEIVKLETSLPKVTSPNIAKYEGGGYVAYNDLTSDLERALQHWV